MSTNSLLASLYGGGNNSSHLSTTTRSSSLFTKQYSFMTATQNEQRTRPSSVSKVIENSSPNELIKWTPLIKTVHKLTAKIKKNYFFFWCRMEAYLKSKNKLKNQDKQNIKEVTNTLIVEQIKLKQQRQQNGKDKIPLSQNTKILNETNTDFKIPIQKLIAENKPLSVQQRLSVQQTKLLPVFSHQQLSKPSVKQNYIESQQNLTSNSLIIPEQMNKIEKISQKLTQQKLKIQRDTQLSNFVINLSKLNYKISSKVLLSSFITLKKFSLKICAMRKMCTLQFIQNKKNSMFEVFRVLKKNSHQIMKSQIIANNLKILIKKSKLQTVKFLYKKLSEENKLNAIKEQKNEIKVQEAKNDKLLVSFQRLSFEKSSERALQTPRFKIQGDNKTIQEKQLSEKPLLTKFKKEQQNQQKPQIIQPNLNIAKTVTQFWFSTNFKQSITIKNDNPIQKHFHHQSHHERMKKLNRLYSEQPFLQLPDISEITLFDSVIKNNSTLFQKKRSQNKSMNTSLVSSIKLYTEREKSISLNSTNSLGKQDFPISPRFDQHFSSMKYPQQLFKKSSSCANITVTKNSSNSNLKSNPNTPGSGKKIVGLFSKKKSVQLFSRDSVQKNFQSKLQSTKSAVLKKFDLFTQLKTQKPKQQYKQKVVLSNSKENHRNETNRKVQKEKVSDLKNSVPLNFSQPKSNYDSSKKIYHQNSSKIVERFNDMSAKRVGTEPKKQISSSKKENQSRNLNEKSSVKKMKSRNESCKQNQLSEFNTISKKVISYEEFMKHFPCQKISSTRTPLKEVSENEPIFQCIQMTDQDFCSKELNDCYGSYSAQLLKGKNENTQQKSKKLRSKIEKMQVNTARKMKMQIENMINQRKKSSIGILKF